MSNDKLWRAATDGEEDEVIRLLKTPEGRAGLEYEVRAAAALPVRTAVVPAPPFHALPPPARRVAPLRRSAAGAPPGHGVRRHVTRATRGRRRWSLRRGAQGQWCG